MKEYRIQVFCQNNLSINVYFDSRDEAIIFGAKQLSKPDVTHVFLLKHFFERTYDIEMEIK